MSKMIFISLPVRDLAASTGFYRAIGCTRNEQFSDETTACMNWSDTISFMLLNHVIYGTFTDKPIADARKVSPMMVALTLDSREAVDAMVEAAAANGGTADTNPVQDFGFMYGRDFTDPDGHVWGAMWMDPAAIPAKDA